MRGWSELGEAELTARITDLLDHVDDYQRLIDPVSWRQGLEDGVVAVMAAMTPTPDESNDGAEGVGAVWAYEFCQAFGLDGISVISRVAAAKGEAGEKEGNPPHESGPARCWSTDQGLGRTPI
jgi:hypothetical protein